MKLTPQANGWTVVGLTFSILERIELGETFFPLPVYYAPVLPFSILERIELGETSGARYHKISRRYFQYPRTDRIG